MLKTFLQKLHQSFNICLTWFWTSTLNEYFKFRFEVLRFDLLNPALHIRYQFPKMKYMHFSRKYLKKELAWPFENAASFLLYYSYGIHSTDLIRSKSKCLLLHSAYILQLHLPNFHKQITISTLKIGIDKISYPLTIWLESLW